MWQKYYVFYDVGNTMPFSPKTIDFLIENRLHDSREWFESHKKEYRDFVISPLRELVIAFGCTGGHHRSVTFAERMRSHLAEKDVRVLIHHRDIKR